MFAHRTLALSLRRPLSIRRLSTSQIAASATTKRSPLAATVLRTDPPAKIKTFHEIKAESDLVGSGAAPGTVPTDLEQATGLERLEILGKMEGIDIFDMKPLDASRKGTLKQPITIQSFGEERYLGCTGHPVDSHAVIWLTVSKDRPIERCPECGSVYKMDYVGPEESHGHHHDEHHSHEPLDPPTMADFVKPAYW